MSRSWVSAIALVVTAIAGGGALAMEPALDKIQRYIERRHEDVRHINADDFAALDKDTVIVFDVREAAEYEVSHIEGAIRIDPAVRPADFIGQYGGRLRKKTAVFYCSVGRRSSSLVSRLGNLEQTTQARASYNLKGGLFHWRNENRLLTRNGHTTSYIHPYNIYWGRLIEDKDAIRFNPTPPSAASSGNKELYEVLPFSRVIDR